VILNGSHVDSKYRIRRDKPIMTGGSGSSQVHKPEPQPHHHVEEDSLDHAAKEEVVMVDDDVQPHSMEEEPQPLDTYPGGPYDCVARNMYDGQVRFSNLTFLYYVYFLYLCKLMLLLLLLLFCIFIPI